MKNDTDKSIEVVFRERLREVRKAKNMTQNDLAKAANMTRGQVAYHESKSDIEGKSTNPSLVTIKRFADALEIAPRDLIEEPGYDSSLDRLIHEIKALSLIELDAVKKAISDPKKDQ